MAQIVISTPEDLQTIVSAANSNLAQEGTGTRFAIQPVPQPGRGCRERLVIWHSGANGVAISRTEVAIRFDGQIAAFHPKFKWEPGEGDGEERRNLQQLLETILYEDQRYVSRRRRRR